MFKNVAAVILGVAFSNISFANTVCTDNMQNMFCGNGTVDSVINLGNTILSGTTVTNKTIVTGNLSVENADLNILTVIGETQLTNTRLHGNSSLTGTLNIKNSKFDQSTSIIGKVNLENVTFDERLTSVGNINAANSHFYKNVEFTFLTAQLSSSTFQSLFIKKNSRHNETQTLYLRDNTIINGNIEFQGKKGIVIVSGGSKINGDVVGGTVQY